MKFSCSCQPRWLKRKKSGRAMCRHFAAISPHHYQVTTVQSVFVEIVCEQREVGSANSELSATLTHDSAVNPFSSIKGQRLVSTSKRICIWCQYTEYILKLISGEKDVISLP
ncbi:unnamed protein product [Hermetia illucens]|uniref:Uncharacterized protein n=1 Tax=Hermetia illucens TaxID=343691 RepID=A0A7R8USJ1_HERIL|nr:unnamed protein product [Hermetia illucens]